MTDTALSEEKYKILVIDDEPDVLQTIADSIRSDSYLIETQSDPRVALSRLQTERYDLVLTDLMMPDVSGMDIAKFVCHDLEGDCEVVVITAHATLQTAIESLQMGVYDYIQKPFDADELRVVVRHVTEKLTLQRQNQRLTAKNNRLLNHLSTLQDISKILYQLSDEDAAGEMVLDTMIEYFNLSRVALLKMDSKSGRFRFSLQKGFTGEWSGFSFAPEQALNGQIPGKSGALHVDIRHGSLTVGDDHVYNVDNGRLTLVPVVFQERIQAWLACFIEKEHPHLPEDIDTLLTILANHIAPIVNGVGETLRGGYNDQLLFEHIQSHVKEAAHLLRPVGFSLFRFDVIYEGDKPFLIRDALESIQIKIRALVEEPVEVVWRSVDTVLFILPEKDYFLSESFSRDLIEEIEHYIKNVNAPFHVITSYACLGYPECGDDAAALLWRLWVKMLQDGLNAHRDFLEKGLYEKS